MHVHGLGIDPADDALYIATHTGLFRVPEGSTEATRVAGRFQDTMGFKVVGPNHFIGSGHPDGRENLPPLLGLIESRDAGKTWDSVSLMGEADFHVLESLGDRVYGFDSSSGALLASGDGERFVRAKAPAPLVGLGIDPADPDHLVASGPRELFRSRDAGRSWDPIDGPAGLVEWPPEGDLYVATANGEIQRSSDAGATWERAGGTGGEPAAFEGVGAEELLVAFHDGTVKESPDGGRSWTIRSRP